MAVSRKRVSLLIDAGACRWTYSLPRADVGWGCHPRSPGKADTHTLNHSKRSCAVGSVDAGEDRGLHHDQAAIDVQACGPHALRYPSHFSWRTDEHVAPGLFALPTSDGRPDGGARWLRLTAGAIACSYATAHRNAVGFDRGSRPAGGDTSRWQASPPAIRSGGCPGGRIHGVQCADRYIFAGWRPSLVPDPARDDKPRLRRHGDRPAGDRSAGSDRGNPSILVGRGHPQLLRCRARGRSVHAGKRSRAGIRSTVVNRSAQNRSHWIFVAAAYGRVGNFPTGPLH